MVRASEIREQLRKLLAEQLSLDQFEDWFVPYSWNIHKHGDEQAQQLAYAIGHALSEFAEDSAALRDALLEACLSVEEPSFFVNRYGESSSASESNAEAMSDEIAVG